MSIAITVPAPATIKTFGDIVAKIPEWTDGRISSDRIAECIALAEDEIIRRLTIKPVRPMLVAAPVTINAEFIDLPAGYIKSVSFEYMDGTMPEQIDYIDPITLTLERNRNANYLGYSFFGTPGAPKYFTTTATQLRILPVPSTTYPGTLLYLQKLAGLSPANQTNWFLNDHPSVYWYGTLAQAYAFLPDVEKSTAAYQVFSRLLDEALAAYPKSSSMARLHTDLPVSPRWNNGWYGGW